MCWKKVNPAALLLAALTACSPPPPTHTYNTIVFGTTVALTVQGAAPDTAAASAAVFAHFEDMHRRFHPWRDGELKTLNDRIAAGALPITVSAPMAEMLRRGQRYAKKSEGLFNPGIGALVRLWGFHADTPPTAPPPQHAIAALRDARPDIAAVMLDGNIIRAAPPAVQLDFGALAKGVALDNARRLLKARGIDNALINIGGNIAALGTNGDRPWRIALALHDRAAPDAIIALHDGEAVATSGGSERHFMHNGKRYHHILDPRSGMPAADTTAAAVISHGAESGAISDAAATALVIADAATAARLLPRFNITLAWRANATPTPAMTKRLKETP